MHLPEWCATCGREVPNEEVMGQQYSYDDRMHYDGVSEWIHIPCGRREGRWTHRELTGADGEPPYGGPLFQRSKRFTDD